MYETHSAGNTKHMQPFAKPRTPHPETDSNETINIDNISDHNDPIMLAPHANVIKLDKESVGNVFVFAAFVGKQDGTIYSVLTGVFPFMFLEGNVCFLIVYHYKTNTILASPIVSFEDSDILLTAYQSQFELLESKGYQIQLNVMDNQACKMIKKYLPTK
jgi:hypothetical protein